MSAFNDLDITCEQCGEEFRGTVWTAIHAGVDPELKELLLGGELNMVMCPKCSHVAFQDRFLIYQEPADELIAYVHPEAEQEHRDEFHSLMLAGFRQAQEGFPAKERLDYDPILLFGLEALVELINEERDWTEQSDVAEAICKAKGIALVRVRPSVSRTRHLPRVLPRSGTGGVAARQDVIDGFKALLAENSLLTFYADCLKEIEADPAWRIDDIR